MDAYAIGFLAMLGFMALVGISALVFLSLDSQSTKSQDPRIRYISVRRVNTRTIETVDVTGQVEEWQRSVQS